MLPIIGTERVVLAVYTKVSARCSEGPAIRLLTDWTPPEGKRATGGLVRSFGRICGSMSRIEKDLKNPRLRNRKDVVRGRGKRRDLVMMAAKTLRSVI